MTSCWLENKNLFVSVRSALYQTSPDSVQHLQTVLNECQSLLLNPLHNKPKNSTDRAKLQLSAKDGLVLKDNDEKPLVFPQNYVDEALILSDLFDLNEIFALQLVVYAQCSRVDFPDIARGLLAVYLFYKNRWHLAETLKILIQNSNGASWSFDDEGGQELRSILSNYLENLNSNGFFRNLLDCVSRYDIFGEVEKLQNPNVKGLGEGKHRKMIVDTINETFEAFSDCLFYFTCQYPLNSTDFQLLCANVRKINLSGDDKSRPLDRMKISLILSLAQAIDVSNAENAESEDNFIKLAPFAKDTRTLKTYSSEICESVWCETDLESFFDLLWSISLRILSQNPFSQNAMSGLEQDEEDLMDRCLNGRNLFNWIKNRLCNVECVIFREEFMFRRVHNFLTQLVAYFPIKIKELRIQTEQECSSMKNNLPRTANLHFEELLTLIGDFYQNDKTKINLSEQFFNCCRTSNIDSKFSNFKAILHKFVRNSGESIHYYSNLYIAYLHMLTGLCRSESSCSSCFAMLKIFGASGPHLTPVSLDNFFRSMSVYYQALRSDTQLALFKSTHHETPCIAPDELKGLQFWLKLLTKIADQDPQARISFCESNQWCCVPNLMGLVSCELPLELKADVLKFLASLCKSRELLNFLVEGISSSGILSFSPIDGKILGLKEELDLVESRNETYPLSVGLIGLLISLIESSDPSQLSLKPIDLYYDLFINHLLVQLPNRSFKNSTEKWLLYSAASELLCKLVENFDISPQNVREKCVGTTTFLAVLNDGPLFRLNFKCNRFDFFRITIHMNFSTYSEFLAYVNQSKCPKLIQICQKLMYEVKRSWVPSNFEHKLSTRLPNFFLHELHIISVLDTGLEILDRYVPFPGFEEFKTTIYNFLKFLLIILEKENIFVEYLRQVDSACLTPTLDVLLRTINPKSGQPDYIVKILSYLSLYNFMPRQGLIVVKIAAILNSMYGIKSRLLRYFCYKPQLCSRILNGFVSCLNLDEVDASLNEENEESAIFREDNFETLELGRIRCLTAQNVLEFLIDDLKNDENSSTDSTNSTSTIGYFLLGFDLKECTKTVFQNAGVDQTPKNCLHAVLEIANSYNSQDLRQSSFGALFEPTFRLLYWLCAKKNTRESILSFLRNNYDFVYNHLRNLVLVDADEDVKIVNQEIIGWLLKITAVELKSLSELNRKSHLNRILSVLFDENLNANEFSTTSNISMASRLKMVPQNDEFKLLNFLTYFKLDDEELTQPALDFLDAKRLSQLIKTFTFENKKHYGQCDVLKLHELLRLEANSLQDTTISGRTHLFYTEIEKVLYCVVQYNKLQKFSYLRQHSYNSWRQLAEVIFYACDLSSFISVEQRVRRISQCLIHILRVDNAQLSQIVANTTLILTKSLRRQFTSVVVAEQQNSSTFSDDREKTADGFYKYVNVLDGTFVKNATEMKNLDQLKHLSILSTAFEIFLDTMLKPENKRLPVSRALLYGSLLNFLRLTSAEDDGVVIQKAQYPSVKERLIDQHAAILASRLTEIVNLLCKDALDGPEMCKVLASCCLETIRDQELCDDRIMSLLANKGYASDSLFSSYFVDEKV